MNCQATTRWTRAVPYLFTALILLLLYAEVTALQWAGGAFHSEWGYFADEAAHYVTGLMVHDYLTSGEWGSPLQFAEQYYARYPKIGLGNWPPLFYGFQAAWGLLFSHERSSTVLFAGLQTWLLASVLYLVLRRHFGWLLALSMASIFIAIPLIQQLSGVAMADIMVTFFSFCAMLCFAEYVQTDRWQWSAAFGVLASLAILTKGTGFMLGFLPVYFVALSRNFDRLKQVSFYAPALIVALLCAPWYLFTLGVASRSWTQDGWSTAYALATLSLFGKSLLFYLGPVLTSLAAIGLIGAVAQPRERESRQILALCAVSFILGLLSFHLLVPNGPVQRFLVPAIPPILVLAASGCEFLVARLAPTQPRRAAIQAGTILAIVGMFLIQAFYVPAQQNEGFRRVVESLQEKGELADSVILVSSDVKGEGMLIAEVARLDHRNKRCVVLRSSKTFAVSSWDSKNKLRVLYESPKEIQNYLEGVPVDFVVLDTSIPKADADLRQHSQLLAAVESNPDCWQLIGAFDRRNGTTHRRPSSNSCVPDAIRAYRRMGVRVPGREIRIDMRESLGRDIVIPLQSRRQRRSPDEAGLRPQG